MQNIVDICGDLKTVSPKYLHRCVYDLQTWVIDTYILVRDYICGPPIPTNLYYYGQELIRKVHIVFTAALLSGELGAVLVIVDINEVLVTARLTKVFCPGHHPPHCTAQSSMAKS